MRMHCKPALPRELSLYPSLTSHTSPRRSHASRIPSSSAQKQRDGRAKTVSKKAEEDPVIEGLKLDVSAAELSERLTKLIESHRSRATGCAERLRRLASIERETDDAGRMLRELGWQGGCDALQKRLAKQRARHLRHAAWLTFLRDHLPQGEIYRLGERDLWLVALLV